MGFIMSSKLFNKLKTLLKDINQLVYGSNFSEPSLGDQKDYSPLKSILITSGVGETLARGFRLHLDGERGDEEIGWLLMGFREKDKAVVLAAIPSGDMREASGTHVRFNSRAQAIAGRILKKREPRLEVLGLFHTHPGTLRRPSSGDFRGDIEWIEKIPGKQGVFGIGTVEDQSKSTSHEYYSRFVSPFAYQRDGLRFSWYSLGHGDTNYHEIRTRWALGDDISQFLHPAWMVIEKNANGIERILAQQTGSTCDVVPFQGTSSFCVAVPTAYPRGVIRAFILEKNVKYFFEQNEQQYAIDVQENEVDRGIYLVLAELGKKS